MKSFYLIGALVSIVYSEVKDNSAYNALNNFALRFLEETNKDISETANLAISPYTIWTAMAIVNEGARSLTAKELETTLGIPHEGSDREAFRNLQQIIVRNTAQAQEGVTLEVLNSVFARLEAELNNTYVDMIRKVYNVEVEGVDFNNVPAATRHINDKINQFTRGRVKEIVTEDAVRYAELFITSALFFKGLWDKKFEKINTKTQPFYNERRETIAQVPMMRNNGSFPFSGRVLNGLASAVELPYKGNRTSMIVLMPVRGTLSSLLHQLSQTPITSVLNDLQVARETFGDVDIIVDLPRFNISSDLHLNDVLQRLGIHNAFDERESDLSGLSQKALRITRVIHKARIEVDEEGTVGAAVTEADATYKGGPVKFVANRPFAFFIVDKASHTIMLMGKIGNPNEV